MSFGRYGGRMIHALRSLMRDENPDLTGALPSATGANAVAVGKGNAAGGDSSAVLGGHNNTIPSAGNHSTVIGGYNCTLGGVTHALVWGFQSGSRALSGYVAIPEGELVQPAATIDGVTYDFTSGDDRSGEETVVVDAGGLNPQTIAAGESVPPDSYAPTGGTTAQIVSFGVNFHAFGENVHVVSDGEAIGSFMETHGYDPAYAEAFGPALYGLRGNHSWAFGYQSDSSGVECFTFGRGAKTAGRASYNLSRRTDVAGLHCFAAGTYRSQVEGWHTHAAGSHVATDRHAHTRAWASGSFRALGDNQVSEHLLSRFVTTSGTYMSLLLDEPRNTYEAHRLDVVSRNEITLRADGRYRIKAQIIGADPAGTAVHCRDLDLVVQMSSGTATELATSDTTVHDVGGLESVYLFDGGIFRIRGRGIAGAHWQAHVTVQALAFAAPPDRWPWGLDRGFIWPAWAQPDATLDIDFANDRAAWRADTTFGTKVHLGTVADAFAALGADVSDPLAGATLVYGGLEMTSGAAPTLSDLTAVGGPGTAGTLCVLYDWDAVPAADEDVLTIEDTDNAPGGRIWYDHSETAVTTTLTSDSGTSSDFAAGAVGAYDWRLTTIRWDADSFDVWSIYSNTANETVSGFTPGDLSRIVIGHGSAADFTGRIARLAYTPAKLDSGTASAWLAR